MMTAPSETSELITDIGELTTQVDGEPRRLDRAMLVQGGRIRCHYPLGDATRDARIKADREPTTKAAS